MGRGSEGRGWKGGEGKGGETNEGEGREGEGRGGEGRGGEGRGGFLSLSLTQRRAAPFSHKFPGPFIQQDVVVSLHAAEKSLLDRRSALRLLAKTIGRHSRHNATPDRHVFRHHAGTRKSSKAVLIR